MEAENIVYIPFGNDEILQDAFLQSAANEVNSYVQSKPWSLKKKNKFMEAYSDLMSRGITGASIRNGQWYIDHNGGLIDFDSMPDKDRRIYEDAASFIKALMEKAPSRAKLAELEAADKKDLPLFDNAFFTLDFTNYLSNQMFGGGDVDISYWNELDPRGTNGLRGTKNRAETLAQYLLNYSNQLLEGKYNFEGSPFKDLNEFKSRINEAVTALRTENVNDDTPALLRLGLKPNTFLYNGGDDRMPNGQEMTYNLYYNEYLPALEKAELEKAAAEQLAKQQALRELALKQISKLRFITPKNGKVPTFLEIQAKYPGLDLRQVFSGELDSKLRIELWSLFNELDRRGKLSSLSLEENTLFGRFSNLLSRLRKINGIEGYYWDSAAKRIVIPTEIGGQALNSTTDDSLLITPTKGDTPRGGGEGLTDADRRDIAATLLDLGAVINPEVISGTGMALGASLLRGTNREKFGWDSVFDWGTAALGGLPLLGDAVTGAKFVKNVLGLFKIAAVWRAIENSPEAYEAAKKILKGGLKAVKDLTPNDYRAISNVLMGLFTGRSHVTHNLRQRRVLQKSGYEVKDSWHNRAGITSSVPKSENIIFKAKINGRDLEIELDGKVSEKLNLALQEKDAVKREEAVRKILVQEGKLNSRDNLTLESIPEGNKVVSKITPGWVTQRRLKSKMVGSRPSERLRTGEDVFEDWLLERNIWSKIGLGSNRTMRDTRRRMRITSPTQQSSLQQQALQLQTLQLQNQGGTLAGQGTTPVNPNPTPNPNPNPGPNPNPSPGPTPNLNPRNLPVVGTAAGPARTSINNSGTNNSGTNPFRVVYSHSEPNLGPTEAPSLGRASSSRLLPPPSSNILPNSNTSSRRTYLEPSSEWSLGQGGNKKDGDLVRSAFYGSSKRGGRRKYVDFDKAYSETMNFGNGESLNINITKDGKLVVTDSSGNTVVSNYDIKKGNSLFDGVVDSKIYGEDVKAQIAKIVREHRNKLIEAGKIKPFSLEFIKSIKDLKKKGFLYKQGGQLTSRLILDNFYIKNNMI